ncbi:hypothetical protein [Nitrospira sp. Ecomares 2.1]
MTVTDRSDTNQEQDFPNEFVLSGRQRALHSKLGQKNTQLGSIYLGALHVLNQNQNPDRFALAAHGLRELMEKLPRYLEIPIEANDTSLMQMSRTLADQWRRAKNQSKCHNDTLWDGVLDEPLRKYLGESENFFSKFDKNRPSHKKQAANVIRRLDPQGQTLPLTIENLRVKEWDHCRDYFVAVSHHNHSTAQQEMEQWINALEVFLLDRLVPQTFDDFSIIAAIIKEGESND